MPRIVVLPAFHMLHTPELDAGLLLVVNACGDRANAAIDLVEDLILERFQAGR